MEDARQFHRRSGALLALFAVSLALFAAVLYNAQVIGHTEFLQQSSTQVTISQTVDSFRGIITDRNGKVLVSNRLVYNLSFDPGEVPETEDEPLTVSVAEAVLRLCRLCEEQGVAWTDTLPISREAPYVFTTADAGATARTRLENYLKDRGWSDKALTEEDPWPTVSEERRQELKLTDDTLTADMLLDWMAEDFGLNEGIIPGGPDRFSPEETRIIVGVLYETALRELAQNAATAPYVFASDVSADLIALLTDGGFDGAVVESESVRQYHTDAAAHILGRVGAIESREELDALNAPYDEALAAGEDVSALIRYQLDDKVGKDGVEKAFESYLCGREGTRLVTTDASGKITGEIYEVEPQPGGAVALTIDIDFQEDVERILADAVEAMNAAGETYGGEEAAATRGGAAAVVSVKDSSILALASYPTYSQRTYLEDVSALTEDSRSPLVNRALNWALAPGSTFKPCTAVAALESGAITTSSIIRCTGRYMYYYDPSNPAGSYAPWCWNRSGHGSLNVSQAIYHSCNYFFYEAGRLTGISALDEYARGFGLGEPTGVELGETTGTVAGPEYSANKGEQWYDGNTIQAAIGQSDNSFTVLQLANYIATLLRQGERLDAHLLDHVSSYDGSEIVYTHEPQILSDLDISAETLEAVKKGMGDLAATGSVSSYFQNCVVTAGAKTGSAQTGTEIANGVFVCFAPFDDPEIAVAVAIEKGNAGAALASTAVDILNAWFSPGDIGTALVPEGTLLP